MLELAVLVVLVTFLQAVQVHQEQEQVLAAVVAEQVLLVLAQMQLATLEVTAVLVAAVAALAQH